ncbi:MAG: PIG-L deacetylase family protein [Dermatophilaceae bacterium]|nr:PIG-L family deacetylase [Intrasporangiaceae bacterium]
MSDLTALPEDVFDRVLCVVAHPDDIEYGLAAAVHRWTQAGKEVSYSLLTRGEAGIATMSPEDAGPVREAEEIESARIVGVSDVRFGAHHDGRVDDGLDVRRDIAREIRRTRPGLVVAQNFDVRFLGGMVNQADHRAVGLATLDAVADAGNRWIFPELLDEGFEPWEGVRLIAITASPSPTHFVDVGDHFEAAVASLEAHDAYNSALPESFPAPRRLLEQILGEGGRLADVEYAVALEVIDRR